MKYDILHTYSHHGDHVAVRHMHVVVSLVAAHRGTLCCALDHQHHHTPFSHHHRHHHHNHHGDDDARASSSSSCASASRYYRGDVMVMGFVMKGVIVLLVLHLPSS